MRDCNFKTSTLSPEKLLRASLTIYCHAVREQVLVFDNFGRQAWRCTPIHTKKCVSLLTRGTCLVPVLCVINLSYYPYCNHYLFQHELNTRLFFFVLSKVSLFTSQFHCFRFAVRFSSSLLFFYSKSCSVRSFTFSLFTQRKLFCMLFVHGQLKP